MKKMEASSKKSETGTSEVPSQAECEYTMAKYWGTFDDYDELVMQFGYLTLFSVAFPLTPFLAIGANFIEQRLDLWKMLHVYQKPISSRVYDIGSFFFSLHHFLFVSISILKFVLR